jgi:hypothetical protein
VPPRGPTTATFRPAASGKRPSLFRRSTSDCRAASWAIPWCSVELRASMPIEVHETRPGGSKRPARKWGRYDRSHAWSTESSLARPAATALCRLSVHTVEPISMSVPLLRAIAAAPMALALTGGPIRLLTAPQSVVTCASDLFQRPRTTSFRTKPFAQLGWPLMAS